MSLGRRLADWWDRRTGARDLRRLALDEPLPAGTGWWFTIGSLLLFGLALQTVTGIGLALFYAPTPDHAWDSVRYIETEVRGGAFLRGLHHWGASLLVVAAVLHLARVVYFGSYRPPREVTWLAGLALFALILAFGLTGYLLPWDQRAYWATVVTINIAALAPVAGEFVATLMRGGADVGALTLTRWYALHVVVLPALTAALVLWHLYLMRRHGISGPVAPQRGRAEMFFPHQAARDLVVALAAGILVAVLAWQGAPALEPPADPSASDYSPRPEWYFLGLFELLKYFPGRWEVVGAIVLPGLVAAWLALLPWLDRGRSREPRARQWTLVPFTAGLAIVSALTVMGARDRPATASTWNLQEIGGAAIAMTGDRCARCHVGGGAAAPIVPGAIRQPASWLAMHVADPIVMAPGLREPPQTPVSETRSILAGLARLRSAPPPVVAPVELGVYVTLSRYCLNCHRIDGAGAGEAPDLSRAGRETSAETIEQRIIDPPLVDPMAEMPAFGDRLAASEIRALAVWLGARR